MIVDIEGSHGFVVSGPSGSYPDAPFIVTLPIEDGEVVWSADKETAIKQMESFVRESQQVLITLYGFGPIDGGTSPALRLVPPLAPGPVKAVADLETVAA